MTLGLGTGSTARWFIEAVADLVRRGWTLRGVPTSSASAQQATELGIPVVELDASGVDLAVDGADCVDPVLRLVKGAGGAMVREKIVAAASRRFVVVVDESKLSPHLVGPVPVEVIRFGVAATLVQLEATGAPFALRRDSHGLVVSDNGNLIADGSFGRIDDPEGLAERISAVPGAVGHGLFLGMADLLLAARADGRVDRLVPPA
jgi:ribose 5-phosphate isomerase A